MKPGVMLLAAAMQETLECLFWDTQGVPLLYVGGRYVVRGRYVVHSSWAVHSYQVAF